MLTFPVPLEACWPLCACLAPVPGYVFGGERLALESEVASAGSSLLSKEHYQQANSWHVGLDQEHSPGRRVSGHTLLLGCRWPQQFLGNTVSLCPWGGVSPSRAGPGFSWFTLLCSLPALWPQPCSPHARRQTPQCLLKTVLPSGPFPMLCPLPAVPSLPSTP